MSSLDILYWFWKNGFEIWNGNKMGTQGGFFSTNIVFYLLFLARNCTGFSNSEFKEAQ